MRKRLAAALVIAACAPRPGWCQGPVRSGPEFRINAYTTGEQLEPSVARVAGGGFLAAWMGPDGNGYGIPGRLFDASGAPQGVTDFRINSYTTGNQLYVDLAPVAAGGFVAVWESFGEDGDDFGIFGQKYDASLVPQGGPFSVNAYTTGQQIMPSIASDAAGAFVIVWEGQSADGFLEISAQRYDSAGAPQAGPLAVNVYTTGLQRDAFVAWAGAGNFVVVWSSSLQDGSSVGVFGQRYDAAGVPQGAPFGVNTYTTGLQRAGAVAADSAGNFVVVFTSESTEDNGVGVWARRYDPAGVAQGPPFRVNQYTTGSQTEPAAGLDERGNFVVAWSSADQDGSAQGVFVRAFDASGPLGGDVAVNSYTTGAQRYPAVAMDPDGQFVVVWTSYGQDGSGAGIFGQRLIPDALFRDGFEGASLAVWSAAATDGGDLAVSGLAAMGLTSFGLRALVDDTAGLYVQDDTPEDAERYRARFYFDPNGFDPGEALAHRRTRIFIAFEEGPRRLAAVVLRRLNGEYSLMARARLDDNTQANTPFTSIGDGPHFVEVDWRRSSAPDALDGSLELWIDGASAAALTGLDNSVSAVDFVRLGALSVKTGASGTMYWDQFESRRYTYIGP